MAAKSQRVVIIGGGFAGVWAALGAAATRQLFDMEREIDITLISPGEDLVIRPRLYESDLRGVRVPLHGVLPQLRINHVDGMVDKILPAERQLKVIGVGAEHRISYDQLIICSGSRRRVPLEAADHYGVDTLSEASALHAFMRRSRSVRPRVVVIGSNFTGIEVATELASRAEVHLVEQADRIAPEFGPAARDVIEQALQSLHINLHRNTRVELGEEGQALLGDGRQLDADAIIWATGLHAGNVASELGILHDELGRLPVNEMLATEIEGIWAAGDCARARVDEQHTAPMSCQHAMPMGARAGSNAVRALLDQILEPYQQPLYLTCLDLGSAGALLTTGFERNDVVATGQGAKDFKRYINRHVIYPPAHDHDALLKLGATEPANAPTAAFQRLALRSSVVRRSLTKAARDRASDHLTT